MAIADKETGGERANTGEMVCGEGDPSQHATGTGAAAETGGRGNEGKGRKRRKRQLDGGNA